MSVAVREAFDFAAVAEVVSGPARIQFGTRRGATERSDRASPRVVFLETEDVVAIQPLLHRYCFAVDSGTPDETVFLNF